MNVQRKYFSAGIELYPKNKFSNNLSVFRSVYKLLQIGIKRYRYIGTCKIGFVFFTSTDRQSKSTFRDAVMNKYKAEVLDPTWHGEIRPSYSTLLRNYLNNMDKRQHYHCRMQIQLDSICRTRKVIETIFKLTNFTCCVAYILDAKNTEYVSSQMQNLYCFQLQSRTKRISNECHITCTF
jgi:hypothetical protein